LAEPRRALRDVPAETVRGIGIVAIAYLVLTIGDVAAKYALPVAGIAFAMLTRGLFGSATVLALTMAPSAGEGRHGWRRVMPVRWGLVLGRALVHCSVSFCWYRAWLSMSLADTYAIGFTTPLIMTLLAVPMLGERIRWRRALSTVLGFLGVLVMLRPGAGTVQYSPALVYLAFGIFGTALSRILTRLLTMTETAECIAFWLMAVHLPAGLLVLSAFPPAGMDVLTIVALVTLGVANAAAQWLIAVAYGLAPISALAPYEYTALPWGGVLGYLVFGETLAWNTIAGAGVVCAAGLYNWRRERMRRDEAPVAELPPIVQARPAKLAS